MYSKVKIFGHPVHPMLVSFPIAFYTATFFSYVTYAFGGDPFWFRAGYASNMAGVIMAAVAAIPGFIDWSMGIPSGTHAKRDGARHLALNTSALLIFAMNWWMNSGQWDAITPVMRFAILLPLVGLLVTVTAGWFGWKMVQTHHVGVELAPEEERYEERRRAA